jgi:hypothetical protein
MDDRGERGDRCRVVLGQGWVTDGDTEWVTDRDG